MAIDIVTEIVIDRPVAEVADFAANPDNAPAWYENIKSVEWKTSRPLAIGSRVAFVAEFLGRRSAYTYEIIELKAGEQLVMRASDGPFPVETSYTWKALGLVGTRMILRNRGEPHGLSKLMSPIVERTTRDTNRNDLQRLKRLLEAGGSDV